MRLGLAMDDPPHRVRNLDPSPFPKLDQLTPQLPARRGVNSSLRLLNISIYARSQASGACFKRRALSRLLLALLYAVLTPSAR